jgi:hypothetical protein
MPETEEQTERRLQREAETCLLGVLYEDGVTEETSTDSAYVLITYQRPWEGEIEHAGHYLVHVRCDEDDYDDPDLDNHPATRAEGVVELHLTPQEYEYLSIDDVLSHLH